MSHYSMTSRGVWGRAKLGDYVQIVNLRKHFSQGRVARRPVGWSDCMETSAGRKSLHKRSATGYELNSLTIQCILLLKQRTGKRVGAGLVGAASGDAIPEGIGGESPIPKQ